MVRATSSVARLKRKKRLFKLAKGFVGDRKNHLRLTKDAVMSALSFNYEHRKEKKRNFRNLWITRIGIASKMHGVSYSRLIEGLQKAGCGLNRKMLSELAIHDPICFGHVAEKAKSALTV